MPHVTDLFFKEVVRLHNIPISFVFDGDIKFTGPFLEYFMDGQNSRLKFEHFPYSNR